MKIIGTVLAGLAGFVLLLLLWLVLAIPFAWLLTGIFNLTNISFLASLGFWQVYWLLIAAKIMAGSASTS